MGPLAGIKVIEMAGIGPGDVDVAEVYDLSSALELDWYEQIGLCAPGDAEQLLRDGETTLGGRIPVNPSGGLASFGEAVPAQAIAQAVALCRPHVVAAYPITPQTHIVEALSQYCSDGTLKARFINVESEHSAMAAVIDSRSSRTRFART